MNKYHDYIRFSSPEILKTWVDSHYSQTQLDEFDANLHVDDPISDYKGGASQRINEAIRVCTKHGITDIKLEGIDISGLQTQLTKMKVSKNIVATRFTDLKELCIIRKATLFGRAMVYNGFISTTLLKEYYSMEDIKRGRIPISLYVPAGTSGMYLPEVNPEHPEYEFLLPYGMKLKHIGYMKYLVQ